MIWHWSCDVGRSWFLIMVWSNKVNVKIGTRDKSLISIWLTVRRWVV